MALLEVEHLTLRFPAAGGSVPVVDDVSFAIDAGEVLALVGESGCGKSMTALSILRLAPKPGRIEAKRIGLDGRDLRTLPVTEMRRVRGREISMIFQEPMTSLSPVATAGAQVVEAIRLHERVSQRAARDRVEELFRQVGIPDPGARRDAYPHELSGGLKQRVMIAMALATRPRLLIADEPTTALDVTIQAQILELLRGLQRDLGTAILLITHDLGVVNELADRVAVMYAGRIVERGERAEVLGSPRHPYTEGLLASMPAHAVAGQRLTEIAGVVPQPSEWPEGCRFSTRCPRVVDRCRTEVPAVVSLGETQSAACHLVSGEGA
ncbi:MAG: ABC transporter ATP-binding protein [Proteobacteria bacterium]|nr:ABC transporter ATP-binding protein [Pseudomonadota bacterium]